MARVALFVTCLLDALFPEAAKSTVRVLERLGVEVDFPLAQTCCGQMQTNSGYPEAAFVRRYVETFEQHEAVVVPSGSCAASIREQHPRTAREAGDEDLARRSEQLGDKTFELSQFLVGELGVTDVGASFPHRVAYHPACHSLRTLGLGDAPARLLRGVRGLELVALDNERECCGFGGTFAVKYPDISAAMLSSKLSAVINAGPEVLCAVDCSCLMHIGGGLQRRRAGIETRHLAEILAATEGAVHAG
jgi:L-lactate dehydrogenase complex protein LldE